MSQPRIGQVIKLPFYAAAVFTGAKSFVRNPVIGSLWLNQRGLHVARVRLAQMLAAWRRLLIGPFIAVTGDQKRAFAKDGYIKVENFLPDALYEKVRAEAFAHTAAPREMRQGQAITRRVTLDAADRAALPFCREAVEDPRFRGLVRYVAAHFAQPFFYLQVIIADPDGGRADPQTNLHMDTFHPIAKAWLFLHDVGPQDGPFRFVPGSHRLTAERRAWEKAQSIAASGGGNSYSDRGSFRVRPKDLDQMALPQPIEMVVAGNTLVVADTHAFHGRAPSFKATVRVELYATLRRGPFLPWTGLDLLLLPGLRGQAARRLDQLRDTGVRLGFTGHAWRLKPPIQMTDPGPSE